MISKKSLLVADIAATNEARPALAGVLITPDKTVATDSYMLAEITRPKGNISDFPVVPGVKLQEVTEPFIIPATFAKSLEKSIPKSKELPALEHAPLAEKGFEGSDVVNFVTTNLEVTNQHKSRIIQEKFPDYEALMPTSAPAVSIEINADLLLRAAKFLKDFGKGMTLKTITMEVREKNEVLIFRMKNDNHETRLMLMPIRQD